jgi:hypothetical protein
MGVATVIAYRIKSTVEQFLRQEACNLIGNSLVQQRVTLGPRAASKQFLSLRNWDSEALGSNSSHTVT